MELNILEIQIKLKLKNAMIINLEFKGSLRKNQLEPVNAFLKSCEEGSYTNTKLWWNTVLPCGYGKCLGKKMHQL